MFYDYELEDINGRNQMYNVYQLDGRIKAKRFLISKEALRGILTKPLDVSQLDAGRLKTVRLNELKLTEAAKQHF